MPQTGRRYTGAACTNYNIAQVNMGSNFAAARNTKDRFIEKA
jgi:hypothetical protein